MVDDTWQMYANTYIYIKNIKSNTYIILMDHGTYLLASKV